MEPCFEYQSKFFCKGVSAACFVCIFMEGGWIGSRIDGFGLKKRTDCGVKRKIERIWGFRKYGGSRISCKFRPGLRTLPVKKFASWILKELRIVDLRRSLSVCRHFLQYFWDESFFLPKILKMSMSFTFTSLQINFYTYVSLSKGINWKKQTSTLHCNKRIPQYDFT